MKSRVIRHGTRFLLRIIWEGMRGVKRGSAGTVNEPVQVVTVEPEARGDRDPRDSSRRAS
jgi:hypothetical protein